MSTATEAPPAGRPEPKPAKPLVRSRLRSYREYIRSAPAGAISVVVHVIVLLALGFMTTTGAKKPVPIRIDTRLNQDRDVPQFSQLMDEVTEATTDLTKVVAVKAASASGGTGGGSGGAGGGVTGGAGPKVDNSLIPEVKVAARLGMGDVPGRGDLDLKVQIKGEETAVVGDNQAVVDRLTREILRMLSTRKVLVIWMFDESLSMKDDQQDIKNRFEKIYEELNLSGQTKGDALQTVVLSYGKNLTVHTKEPTSDVSEIREAIDKIPVDKTGEEWPCKYVIEVTKQYARYFTQGRRTVVLVIPTDESGERASGERKESDGFHVEDAVAAAKKIQMPIYVIGRQAIFGYPFAYLTYKDPETGDVYWPPITRGPEAPDVECLQTEGLHARWDRQSSGFGPYELVRLARDSGGIYFMMPENDSQIPETFFDPLDMKEYVPEYDIRREYLQHRDASPFRRAIYEVIKVTDGMAVPLTFSIDQQQLRQQAERAYVTARKNRELLAQAYKYLKDVEKQRDHEPSQRWRAHYDLLSGQVFAYQVKLFEYEYFLQDFVSKPQVPKYKPDAKYDVYWSVGHASHKTKTWAPAKFIDEPREKAEDLLNRVLERHPGTPWALRAKTELGRGFSITIAEGRHSKLYGSRAALVPKF
jgi:hypothetical protein